MGEATGQAWISKILAGLVSCICSPGCSGPESKEERGAEHKNHNPQKASPFDPIPDIRRTELVTERNLPVSVCYKLGGTLGQGAYGQVIAAKSKKTQMACALKSVPIEMYERDCKHEFVIAWKLVHPFIAQVYEVFQDSSHVRIIMETCEGGSLYDMVKASSPPKLHETQVVKYVWQMLSGLAYMHHHGFCHRDVKPHNYLLQTVRDNSPLKLIDMGFACPVQPGIPLTQRVGTVECSAPEVVKGSYDEKCDIWSIGIVIFFCCVGYCPFVADEAIECLRKVVKEPLKFEMRDWAQVSADMKAILTDMLTKDPFARPAACELAGSYAGWLLTEPAERERSSSKNCVATTASSSPGKPAQRERSSINSKNSVATTSVSSPGSDVTTAPSSLEMCHVASKESLEVCRSKESLQSIGSVSSKGSSIVKLFRHCTPEAPAEAENKEPLHGKARTKKQSWPRDLMKQARNGAQRISGRISGRRGRHFPFGRCADDG